MGADGTGLGSATAISVERMQLKVMERRPVFSQQEREDERKRIAVQLLDIFQKYSRR